MTMRCLSNMAQGRMEDEWTRTSWLLAMIRNVNCTRRSDCIQPHQVNPMIRRRRMSQEEMKANRRAVLAAFEAKAKV